MISIIIPTYNRPESCYNTVGSILKLKIKSDHEIIIIDDSSSEKYNFSEFGGRVNYFRNDTNSGPSKSRNRGAFLSKGDVIFFVDDDIIITENVFDKHLDLYKRNDKVVSIVSNTVSIADDDCNKLNNKLNGYINSRGVNKIAKDTCIPGHYLTAAFCSIKRDTFLKIGGFDENMQGYGWEDNELGLNIENSGGRIGYVKSDLILHLHNKSLKEWVSQLERSGFNFIYMLDKHPQYRNRLGYDLFNSLSGKFVFNKIFFHIAYFFAAFIPGKLSYIFIRYIFYGAIFRGYKNSLIEQSRKSGVRQLL